MAAHRSSLSRRTLLRSATASIALPIFDALLNDSGTAFAAGEPLPQRFGLFFWGNGVRPDRFRPKGAGSGTSWQLSEELAPLAPLKDYITVLSDMEMKFGGTSHHRGRGGMVAAAYKPGAQIYGIVNGPSIDQIAAKAWEGKTPFPSVQLGISMRAKGGVNATRSAGGTSWRAAGERMPAEFSPLALFNRLFGKPIGADDPHAAQELALKRSILDSVAADAKSLRTRLGSVDQQRLDAHLEGIRALEVSLAGADAACVKPSLPVDPDGENLGHEPLAERNTLMARVLARALACNLTRVFSYEYSGMQADTIFWQVGATEGSHVLTHDDRGLGTKLSPQLERVHAVVVFVMGQFAELLKELKAIPEGAGNLLDSACVVATSELNDGTLHNYDSMPLILAGRAGGKLRSDYHYIANPVRDNVSKALLTALRVVGLPLNELGKDAGYVNQSVSALEL